MKTKEELLCEYFCKKLYASGYRSYRSKRMVDPDGAEVGKTRLELLLPTFLEGKKDSVDATLMFYSKKKMIVETTIDLLHNLTSKISEKKKDDERMKNALWGVEDSFNYEGLALGFDIFRKKCKFLYRKDTGRISLEDPDQFLERIKENERVELRQQSVYGERRYNPFDSRASFKEPYMGRELVIFNSYIPPSWEFYREETTPCPKFFIDLMGHLFPREDTRLYVLQWMKQMITERNETILVLIGPNGIGKNILVSGVFVALVGPHNRFTTGETFFLSKFAEELEEKRLTIFDETTIASDERHRAKKERLKEFTNSTISVEPKGLARRIFTNFNSFVVINNYKNENYMVKRDRRFSIPEITEKPLLEVFSSEEISEFNNNLTNPQFVAAIARYVLSTDMTSFENHKAWKKDMFWDVMFNSLRDWQKIIIEAISTRTKEIYDLEDILDGAGYSNSSLVPGETSLNRFLIEDFSDRDGDSYGRAARRNNAIKIIPSKKYMPPSDFEKGEIENSDNDFELDDIFK